MRTHLGDIKIILLLFTLWRGGLAVVEFFSKEMWPLQSGFLGFTRWANFDGVHYLALVDSGYQQYREAFFPLYHLISRYLFKTTGIVPHMSALFVSHISFILGLIVLVKISRLLIKSSPWRSVLILLSFPTSFYFASVYTESLYFFLSLVTIYAALNRKWWISGVAGFLASATRFIGIYLFIVVLSEYLRYEKRINLIKMLPVFIIPLGLISYMVFLWYKFSDPIAFFHVQKVFAAGRSSDSFVLLPQVLWRYGKILTTIDSHEFTFLISVFELGVLFTSFGILISIWRDKSFPKSLVLYSIFALVTPTLTGTLSSLPRYILVIFPLFLWASTMHNKRIEIVIAIFFIIGLIYFTSAFLQGYFVS